MTIIGTLPTPAASTGSATADEIINSVRDQIPDPVYDASGNPQPSTDGNLLRASTLYGWLDKAVKIVAANLGGWLIDDWTAMAKQQAQPNYTLDRLFVQVSDAYADQWPLTRLDEAPTIYPNAPIQSQPFWYGVHRRADALTLFFWPIEGASDPVTTLSVALGSSGDSAVQVVSTTSFLSFGFLQIENEIIQYQQLSTSPIGVSVLTRGVGGTVPATHAAGVPVTHLSLWCKGKRTPQKIVGATSAIELPLPFLHPLELYVLARARRAEQEFGEARSLMQEFYQEIGRIDANPGWKVSQGAQVKPYGDPSLGGLAYGRVITR